MKHTDFVDSAIKDLLDRGLIVTCEVQPTVVNPLTVSIHSNGKKRLIQLHNILNIILVFLSSIFTQHIIMLTFFIPILNIWGFPG